jgi:hypothetical protein
MADPNGIVWDDEAPVVWDDEQAGPPAADFSNVRGGPAQRFGPVNAPRGTLPGLQDFSPEGMALDPGTAESVAQGAKDIAGELESGVKGAAENYQYPQELDANGQPKRRVGLFEAFGRRAASGFEDLADLADKFNPASAGTRIAASVMGQPTALSGEAEATRVNPEKEQYEGAREELAGNLGADLLTNFAPFERLGSAASKLMKAPWLKTPAKEAALVGELGPGPQGAATADEIVDQALDHAAKSSAGDIAVTPEMRVPAEESRAVVPDAAMDASAAPGPGPADLPTGESVPEQAAPAERAPGGPDLGVAEAQPTTVQPASVGEGGRDTPLFTSSSSPAAASESASEPLYHASLADFDAFKEGTEGTASDPGVFGRGHYVTGDERLAPMYLGPRKAEGTLYTIENRMQNPRVFDSPSEAIDWQGERGTDSPEAAERVRQKYLDAGHDGAIIRNPKTGRTMEAVGFDPEALRVAGKRKLGEAPRAEPPKVDMEGSTDAEAVRGDQGQTRSAGRDGIRGEDQRGENLQRAGQEKRAAFAQRVPETRAVEGADAPEAPGLKEPGQTAINNAKVAEERARRGLEEVKHDLSRTDPEGWERARQRLEDDPNYGRSLAHELVQKARPATKEEVFALIQDRQRIKNERRATYDRAELATDAGDEEKALQERARIEQLDNEMQANDVAARHAGHESAEGLRARQRMSREDYSMAELVQRAKVRKGGKLTAEETARIEAMARDVEKREAAVAKREQAVRDARAKPKSPFGVKDAGKRFDSLVEELKKIADKDQLTPGCIV